MSLMECKDCGKSVSSKAKACPGCGWRVSTWAQIGAESKVLKAESNKIMHAAKSRGDAREKAGRSRTTRTQSISLIIFACIALVAAAAYFYESHRTEIQAELNTRKNAQRREQAMAFESAAVDVSPSELKLQWEKNPTATAAKYVGTRIRFVQKVYIASINGIVWDGVGLDTTGFTQSEIDRMSVGSIVEATCRVAPYDKRVTLDDCYLIYSTPGVRGSL